MWLLTAVSSCNMKVPSLNYMGHKNQANYPSGSTVSYLDDHFYIMGDDASELLILNGELKETGRIPLFPQGEDKRIDKAVKADIESSAVINRNGKKLLLLLGSGSVSPHRDSAFLVDPQTKHIQRLDLESFYDQLRKDFKQLNIEGADQNRMRGIFRSGNDIEHVMYSITNVHVNHSACAVHDVVSCGPPVIEGVGTYIIRTAISFRFNNNSAGNFTLCVNKQVFTKQLARDSNHVIPLIKFI